MGPQEGDGNIVRRWFQRQRNTERRKTTRHPAQGLVAYYWDGGAAVAHKIREIGPAGMFLLTERRWYAGTLVTMTLQRTGVDDASPERAISVQTRVSRQDKDGVGLAFITAETRHAAHGEPRELKVADRQSLEAFLESHLSRPAE